jgi:lipopolysaccharide transport system ATP-binding protein
MSTAIKVENLSKIYRLGEIGTGTISRDLERWYKTKLLGKEDPFLKIGESNDRSKKGASDIVYSLKDINFEIEQGDAVGIIGRNGAGKSTLLKILSRVTTPTTGRINIKGRVASLLEVGTGFHPELTGRENIYLNGAILGMRKKEIDRKLEEIIDFSGVERYIDTPVKRYSSGMYVRLAFAVAAHLESEILIVDEVLAVGDAEFQKKCLGKMGEVSKGEGRTVLFVSHNMAAVKNLCNNSILIRNGKIIEFDKSQKVIEVYNSNFEDVYLTNKTIVSDINRKYNLLREVEFISFELINNHDKIAYSTKDTIEIKIFLKSKINIENFRISFSIKRIDETTIGTYFSDDKITIDKNEKKQVLIKINNHQLAKGIYYIDFSVGIGNELTGLTEFDNVSKVLFFEILYKTKEKNQMINTWPLDWGSINFSDVSIF